MHMINSICEKLPPPICKEAPELCDALRHEEFRLVYQPQYNSKTGRIETLEALLRWDHPKKGTILPGKFILFAEETGAIVPIGEWVLYKACLQNRLWQDQGYKPVRMSVNISTVQLRMKDFVRTVKRVIEEVRIDPSYLELEITESSLMDSVEENILVLNHLRELGVGIALDDFGTGYSSLSYLHRLPVENLKIDKSFIDGLSKDHNKTHIVKFIIDLAHNMNMKVTAEGVELKEQLELLVNYGCDNIQGFFFSKPRPPEYIEVLFANGPVSMSG